MSDSHSSVPMQSWLIEPLAVDVRQALQRLQRLPDAQWIAVMPDVHLAEDVCVGTVLATSDGLYPSAVGGDIGCGMLAVALDASSDLLSSASPAAVMLATLEERVPANRHRHARELPAELAECGLSDSRLERIKHRDGRVQLGTLGRGNHFLEFQQDGDQRLWLMIHSGSRGIGQAITDHHRRCAHLERGLPRLSVKSPEGLAYLRDVAWARDYATENRCAITRSVEAILQTEWNVSIDWGSLIHSDHNHVAAESHFGHTWWVHRKGALTAGANQPGVIPGSMGTVSYHVEGRGCPEALMSSSHGAGRALPRHVARQQIPNRQLSQEMQGVWFDTGRSHTLCEEAPSAYKDVRAVMRAQRSLTRITRELRPVLVYKGR